ncbi:MAG: fur [Cyanobacteria bacterium RYN_339]|nr:fur [Cyanobacteria bacterium RYN_339]
MTYADSALQILRDRGFRQTKPRRMVLETLDVAEVPLSPYEIADRIKEGGNKGDVVSVYRILQALEDNNLVHRVLANGKYRKCHLAPEDECKRHQTQHCHHNLVCRACGKVEEFHCPGMDLVEQLLAAQSSFQIERHALEFNGLCPTCKVA